MAYIKDVLKKKMQESGGKGMSSAKSKAMANMIRELESMGEEAMAGNLKKKVTVASDTDEGLKEGLEMAEEKVDEMSDEESGNELDKAIAEAESSDEYEDMDYDEEMEDAKSDEREDYMAESSDSDYSKMSAEELDAKIKELEKMKAMMS